MSGTVDATELTRSQRTRRRRLRALAATLPPDTSTVIYEWPDGWSVRRIDTLADQEREGQLQGHCLQWASRREYLFPRFSLRDEENLPHRTFALYDLTGYDSAKVAFTPMGVNLKLMGQLFVGPDVMAILTQGRELPEEHRSRLRELVAVTPCPNGALPWDGWQGHRRREAIAFRAAMKEMGWDN